MRPLTANASSSVRRLSRSGFGSGWIAPFGRPTTIVSPAPAPSAVWPNTAVEPDADASAHGSVLPSGPAKHATLVMSAGASTRTDAVSIGTVHSWPIASQNSSS